MKQWFQRLSRREQLMTLTVAAIVAGLVLYAIAWAPLSNAIERHEAGNVRAQETVAWMRQVAADIKRTRAAATASAPESISALVNTTLPQYKLLMQRYQPTGNASAQLWLGDAALPEVIAWLATMERDYGMRLTNVSIASSDKQGAVKTRVKMTKP